jgi:hypothetical protein
MEIHGYKVNDIELIVGDNDMIDADRPCDCCLGSASKVIKASLEGLWEQVFVCKSCLIRGNMFGSISDLDEQIYELAGGRSCG